MYIQVLDAADILLIARTKKESDLNPERGKKLCICFYLADTSLNNWESYRYGLNKRYRRRTWNQKF